jgi:glycosyltransferase involved in cell wall biosynthesis
MKKILIGYPYWGRGGAEVATMWLIEALKNDFEVSLITRGGFDLDELNQVSSTQLKSGEFKMIQLPFHHLLSQTKGGLIWQGVYYRMCRIYARQFDLCITASRTINWGKPAVHILSDVEWNEELMEKYGDREPSKKGLIHRLYSFASQLAEGKSRHNIASDFFIANSQWTAKVSRPYMKQESTVVYPPVPQSHEQHPITSRQNSFLYLGRISSEKRIDIAIRILEKVRVDYPELQFHIAGAFESSPYCQQISEICQQKEWIHIHGALYGQKKEEILQQYRYYINARASEPFGISTAEMIQAGMIPFAFKDGGQQEIIIDDRLVFQTEEEAVVKIKWVLANANQMQPIIENLQSNVEKFSANHFIENMNHCITGIMEKINE